MASTCRDYRIGKSERSVLYMYWWSSRPKLRFLYALFTNTDIYYKFNVWQRIQQTFCMKPLFHVVQLCGQTDFDVVQADNSQNLLCFDIIATNRTQVYMEVYYYAHEER